MRSLVAWAALALLLAGCTGAGREEGPLVGNLAPGFTVDPVNAPRLDLGDLRGKVVLLDLMGVNCPPCRQEMPALREVAQAHAQDPGFALLAVDMAARYPTLGAQGEGDIRAFVEEFNVTWPMAADTDGVGVKYQPIAVPTKVFLDAQGIIRAKHSGGPATAAQMEESIAKARGA